MKTTKTTTRKAKKGVRPYYGVIPKPAKKVKPLPTSTKDALRIEELTAKLKLAHEKANELNGVRAVLKMEFPERSFDQYTPNAVRDLCRQYKEIIAKAAAG